MPPDPCELKISKTKRNSCSSTVFFTLKISKTKRPDYMLGDYDGNALVENKQD